MTRTGRTLQEYLDMGAAGKVALISFVNFLPPESALSRALKPKDETYLWTTTLKTNVILADLYDAFVVSRTKKGHQPKWYPRPQKGRSVGKGAIPISQFWDWWNKGSETNGR